jgi:hypothetical protein
MSKIASSCENCIWSKRYPKVEKPKTADEIWSQKTFWQKFFGDFMMLSFEVELMEDNYDRYINYRRCARYPEVTRKHKDDLCGEHVNNG